MILEVILFGFFQKFVCGNINVDVVLSCNLVEEGAGLDRMSAGSFFTRTPTTLVLRDVAVAPDESLEALTPFLPPSIPDPDAILIEAKVSSPEIPNADALLHADCNDQEVMCEMSLYSARGAQNSSDSPFFMVSLNVEGDQFSTVLIMQTLAVTDESPLMQNKLGLPLSQSGTLLTEVIFVVFSQRKSVSAPLNSDVVLNCGFKQPDIPLAQDMGIEWRLQHKGKGWKVLEMKTRLDDPEGSTVVLEERKGSSIDVAQVVGEGDASLTLTKIKVRDEGSYICTVSIGAFHAQQIVQLHIFQPPQVSLSEEKLVLQANSPQTLSCHCTKYYPLDVQMEWLFLSPTDEEETVFKGHSSLSSHRQHGDGTYSLSSHLTVPSSVSPGTKISCRVSHVALEAPLSFSLMVEGPQTSSYWWILGFLIITVLFFYQVMN